MYLFVVVVDQNSEMCRYDHTDKCVQTFIQYFILYAGQPKPKSESSCTIPCGCEVSEWSPWSECSQTCVLPALSVQGTGVDTGYQERNRRVVSEGEGGGCPHLRERRECVSVKHCDR